MPLLQFICQDKYFESDWVDDLVDENLVTMDEMFYGFTDMVRMDQCLEVLSPILEKSDYALEMTWLKAEVNTSRPYPTLNPYVVKNVRGKEVYYAEHLFEGLEWTKDDQGEEVPDKRFHIWYQNWVFWIFAIPLGISALRRVFILIES